jgi:hypothetical protein
MTLPEAPALECGLDPSVSPCATLAEQSLVVARGHSEQEVNLSGIVVRNLQLEPGPPRPVPLEAWTVSLYWILGREPWQPLGSAPLHCEGSIEPVMTSSSLTVPSQIQVIFLCLRLGLTMEC